MPVITAQITGDWLPLPDPVLRALNLKEGDRLTVEIIDSDPPALLLTKIPPTKP